MPTLSKDDWIEIAIALEGRIDTLEAYLHASTTPEETQMLEQWITHLDTLLTTIGEDGQAMWPKED